MRRNLASLAVVLFLGGCVTTSAGSDAEWTAAKAQFQARAQQCMQENGGSQGAASLPRATAFKAVTCVNKAERDIILPVLTDRGGDVSAVIDRQAALEDLASRYQRGEISGEEFEARSDTANARAMANIRAQANEQERRRDEIAADALERMSDRMQRPTPTTTNCQQLGNTVRCSTW